MPERVVDTNIILRFLMQDNMRQFGQSERLIQRIAERQETVFLPWHCVCEIVFTLQSYYEVPRNEVVEKLSILFSHAGLHIHMKNAVLHALEIYKNTNVSFADALTIAQMQCGGISEIYSFDRHFDRVEGIKRLEP